MLDNYTRLLLEKRERIEDTNKRLDTSLEKQYISLSLHTEKKKENELILNTLDWCIALYKNEQEKTNNL